MDGIGLMIKEHENIKRMLKVIRKICIGIMNGNEIVFKDFESVIDFVRNYADKHHHEKEEKILFDAMLDELGSPAEKLVKYGMYVEHDLGRLYMLDLEKALDNAKAGDPEAKLDIIANAVAYTHLLTRHINKEDEVVYAFARRELGNETLKNVNRKCDSFEEEKNKLGVQNRYILMLEMLEDKYKYIS